MNIYADNLLLIGLGGFGGKVVKRVKKQWCADYPSDYEMQQAPAQVGFLAMDSRDELVADYGRAGRDGGDEAQLAIGEFVLLDNSDVEPYITNSVSQLQSRSHSLPVQVVVVAGMNGRTGSVAVADVISTLHRRYGPSCWIDVVALVTERPMASMDDGHFHGRAQIALGKLEALRGEGIPFTLWLQKDSRKTGQPVDMRQDVMPMVARLLSLLGWQCRQGDGHVAAQLAHHQEFLAGTVASMELTTIEYPLQRILRRLSVAALRGAVWRLMWNNFDSAYGYLERARHAVATMEFREQDFFCEQQAEVDERARFLIDHLSQQWRQQWETGGCGMEDVEELWDAYVKWLDEWQHQARQRMTNYQEEVARIQDGCTQLQQEYDNRGLLQRMIPGVGERMMQRITACNAQRDELQAKLNAYEYALDLTDRMIALSHDKYQNALRLLDTMLRCVQWLDDYYKKLTWHDNRTPRPTDFVIEKTNYPQVQQYELNMLLTKDFIDRVATEFQNQQHISEHDLDWFLSAHVEPMVKEYDDRWYTVPEGMNHDTFGSARELSYEYDSPLHQSVVFAREARGENLDRYVQQLSDRLPAEALLPPVAHVSDVGPTVSIVTCFKATTA